MASRAELLFRQLEASAASADPVAYIDRIVRDRWPETDYLDFKRSGREVDDKRIWSKTLSAFANTEGGVLIWGIDARKINTADGSRQVDAAFETVPVPNPTALEQLLKDVHRDATVEPVRGVEYLTIATPAGPGYVACYVPEGNYKPYRAELEQQKQYWQRIGDRSEVISHAFLRSLFHPRSRAAFTIVAYAVSERVITLDLLNEGPGSAEGVYVRCSRAGEETGIDIRLFQNHWARVMGSATPEGTWVVAGSCGVTIHPAQQIPMYQLHLVGNRDGAWRPLAVGVTVYSRDQAPEEFKVKLEVWPESPVTIHRTVPSEAHEKSAGT